MNFTPRQIAIIKELLESEGPRPSQELADSLHSSVRTIQRELGDMEKELEKCGLALSRSRSKGIAIEGDEEQKAVLKKMLEDKTDTDPSDKLQRRRRLLLMLLKDREPRKMYYYAKLLNVSEATVGSDIEALKPWLEKNRLTVIRRQGYGVVLSGSEQDYREALRRFIHENGGEEIQFFGQLKETPLSEAIMDESDREVCELLDGEIIRSVDGVLSSMDEPRLRAMTANAYAGLVIHIAISVERLKRGGRIEIPDESLASLQSLPDYDLAKRIMQEMEEEFEISFPQEEISYILLHIRGSKMAYARDPSMNYDLGMNTVELLALIDGMIDAYDENLAITLKQDEQFAHGLLVHLGPVIIRLREHMNIFNPLLSEIKEEYPDMFLRCKKAAKVIEEEIGIAVSEEEVGFLAMHFGAAEERALSLRSARRRVHIGIVCASGFGVAQLMSSKLKGQLGDGVKIVAYGKEELTPEVIAKTDFFVSTMNLDDYGVDYLAVSPLIVASDLSKIKYKIKDYAHTHREMRHTDFMEEVRRNEAASTDVLQLLKGFRRFEIDPGLTLTELIHNLAIRMTGSLEKAERITAKILDREQMNTQIFPELGIALLHTKTKDTDKVVFWVCVPREGSAYTDPYFKKIGAVIMMLSPDDDMHRIHAKLLGSISAAFVEDAKFLDAIRHGQEGAIRNFLTGILQDSYYRIVETKDM